MTDQENNENVVNVEEDVEDVQEDVEDIEEGVEDVQEDVEDIEEDKEIEEEEEQESSGSRWWIWLIIALVVLSTMACLFFGGRAALSLFARDEPKESSFLKPTSDDNSSEEMSEDNSSISWEDSVKYAEGGSGPPDPASQLDGNVFVVEHTSRLIAENPSLSSEGCFPNLSSNDWSAIIEWTQQWGIDSPTRLEWQINESRCSIVLPGDITDKISQEDYDEIIDVFAQAGYADTWYVSGPEGSEWGQVSYITDAPINRVHIYSDTLPSMPTTDN